MPKHERRRKHAGTVKFQTKTEHIAMHHPAGPHLLSVWHLLSCSYVNCHYCPRPTGFCRDAMLPYPTQLGLLLNRCQLAYRLSVPPYVRPSVRSASYGLVHWSVTARHRAPDGANHVYGAINVITIAPATLSRTPTRSSVWLVQSSHI